MSTRTIAILGTLDTKGVEHGYLADLIQSRGHRTLLIDVGTLGEPRVRPDIDRVAVATAAGADYAAMLARRDRGEAVTTMSRGAPILLGRLVADGKVQGVIS